jgi:hypothetical protein
MRQATDVLIGEYWLTAGILGFVLERMARRGE